MIWVGLKKKILAKKFQDQKQNWGNQARPRSRAKLATIKHTRIPVTVGTRKEIRVHFQLWVSFFMVRQVVLQGQCIREKSMTHMAVSQVHPLVTNSSRNWLKLSNSIILPVAI